MPTLTPAYDNKIYMKYSKSMIQNKEKNKIAFCQDFGLKYNKATPILCVTYPLTEKNHVDLLLDTVDGILEQGVQIVLLGIGTAKYQNAFTELAEQHSDQIAIVDDNDMNHRKVLAASDIFLATGDTGEIKKDLENALSYGVIPVAPDNKFTNDYNGAQEEGNAFVYKKASKWSFFSGIIRAFENFKFPYDWKTIRVNAMESVSQD
jgi:starch synthase